MSLTTKILSGIFVLVIATAAIHFALRHYTNPAVLGDHSISTEPVDVLISKTSLQIPQNIIRRGRQRISGRQQFIDLYFQWPSLKGYNQEDAAIYESTAQLESLIFVSLIETEPPNSPEQRLEGIYRRFFTGKAWRGPDGLIGQTLDPASGYKSEDVFYARNNSELFVTRCLQEEKLGENNILPTCLYDFQFEKNITVNIRYHRNLLPVWRQIDSSIKRQLISMRVQ
ncbi:MAG: hypothetical protein ABJ081_11715 [Hyphomicrobiales bacterium]